MEITEIGLDNLAGKGVDEMPIEEVRAALKDAGIDTTGAFEKLKQALATRRLADQIVFEIRNLDADIYDTDTTDVYGALVYRIISKGATT